MSTAAAVLSLGLLVGSSASAAERTLLGINLGRSYRTVLQKYGTPTTMTPVVIPTGTAPQLAGQYGGAGGFGGAPGMGEGGLGSSGGAPFGPPTSGGMAPGGMNGPMGSGGTSGGGANSGSMMSGGGGPPVLPSAGGGANSGGGGPGEGGLSGGGMSGGFGEAGGQTGGTQVGNAVLWTYRRGKGVTYEFLINEDGLVAQIALTGQSDAHRTARGVGLGTDFKTVMLRYGQPTQYLITSVGQAGVQQSSVSQAAMVKTNGQVMQTFYPKTHHAAFTFLSNRVVRVVIALAE